MLPAFEEYCSLIASLPDRFPSIQSSTLTAYTIGPFAAEVEGQLIFEADYVLDVSEYNFTQHVSRNTSTFHTRRPPCPSPSFTATLFPPINS